MTPFRLTGTLDGAAPVLLTSPHSGTTLPPGFLHQSRLPAAALRRLEDAHVGALLADAARHGMPLLEAVAARAVIDLNRAEDEYDPAMIAGTVAAAPKITERVQRGYGLFPRLAAPNQPIHRGPIPADLAARRIAGLHRPWHAAIAAGMEAARRRHGVAVLLDVHSMPPLDGSAPASLVIGDRHGRSAAASLTGWLHAAFAGAGLKVVRNAPYAGGHTTERHGRPAAGLHAVQLEFDRSLYMNPETLEPTAGFAAFAAMLAAVLAQLPEALPDLLMPKMPLAAE